MLQIVSAARIDWIDRISIRLFFFFFFLVPEVGDG